ncbi:CRISPR type III-A/MTUBE-associated RAMP protein Csm5 [Desulfonauticus submarinus]|uniref:CRISPR system Cms protein Csm5 n=1 Tax=Desulfonauticus submarinus TaxID=206665 RepID=A0A1H0FV41_9BACT|nr:type III-A CRISPR-associated RAMP protein Csm5 [Desulfonauticus submarinus]SDN98480.1 CRISPR type III-A/MTUBE-associated RAMP protein Csm5 [Desulfonauticus submarinus]
MKGEILNKRYRLKVLSPVHVGYGDVYEPTNFVVDAQKKELLVLNIDKFLLNLPGEELKQFSSICKLGTSYALVKLYQFMSNQLDFVKSHSEIIVRKIKLVSGFVEHFNKVKNLSKDKLNELNKFSINSLSYNPNNNLPIIPGSSIKGAIRTAILNYYQDRADKKVIKEAHYKKKSTVLEKQILKFKDATDDILKRIKVSDFVPIGEVKTKVVYAVNRKKDGRRASGPYQIFEIIEPGAEFEGSISIIKGLDNKAPIDLSFPKLEQIIESFFEGIFATEDKVIEKLGAKFPVPPLGLPIKIGRHSGAEALTVEKFRNIKINQGRKNKPVFLSHATTIWLASEYFKVEDNLSLVPFGRATLFSKEKDNQRKESIVQKSIQQEDIKNQKSVQQKIDVSILKHRFKVR